MALTSQRLGGSAGCVSVSVSCVLIQNEPEQPLLLWPRAATTSLLHLRSRHEEDRVKGFLFFLFYFIFGLFDHCVFPTASANAKFMIIKTKKHIIN